MTPNCNSVNGTRTLKAICPTTTSEIGRDVRRNRQKRTLWKVDLNLRNHGDTDNYGEAGYADGSREGVGGAGRGRYWMNVSGYVAKYLTLS